MGSFNSASSFQLSELQQAYLVLDRATLRHDGLKIETGKLSASHDATPGWRLASGTGERFIDIPIKFSLQEGFPPWVIARVGIAGALHDAKFAFRFQALPVASTLSPHGFTLRLRTWGDSRILQAQVEWMLYAEDHA